MEQLELFDEYQDTPVYVRMSITYNRLGVPHVAYHAFIDIAPHFYTSEALLERYLDLPGVDIDVWHEDPPESMDKAPTHYGGGTTH